MELTEALTVTLLGMGVVFVGLILTSLVIVAFSVVPRLLTRRNPSAAVPGPVVKVVEQGQPVPPEVVTVITTVLEVERRLSLLNPRARLTIARGADRPA